MNSLIAAAIGMANRGKELMVFDWDKAALFIKAKNPKWAAAGLRGDWEWTGGTIYEDGVPIKDSDTYLSSTWAVPELEMDGEIIECYRMESETPGWNYATKWPESALYILNGGEKNHEYNP